MAGFDNKDTTKGFQYKPAAIAALICLAAILICPRDIFAGYTITTSSGRVVHTESYWISKNLLFVGDDREPLRLYSITAIEEDHTSDEERSAHEEEMNGFFGEIDAFLERERGFIEKHEVNQKIIEGLTGLLPQGPASRKEIRGYKKDMKRLIRESRELRDDWDDMILPDRSLVILREIKSLQLMSIGLAIEEKVRFIKTWDPTHREYAIEHCRQARSFDEAFKREMQKLAGNSDR